jgi:hypothetical protein
MPFNNGFDYGVKESPLTKSVFVLGYEIGQLLPPPPSNFIITQDGQLILTQDGNNNLITE